LTVSILLLLLLLLLLRWALTVGIRKRIRRGRAAVVGHGWVVLAHEEKRMNLETQVKSSC
jgi:hypothetical protein